MIAKQRLIQIWLLVVAMLPAVNGGAQPVAGVAGGGFHSLFLKSGGSLWAMGDNGDGQLGDGNYSTQYPFYGTNRPELIVASNVTAIAAGEYHSLFLESNSSLWAMGYNYQGQLGDGTYSTTNQPELIVASNVTAIAAGGYHSLFLKGDGSLWTMGDNTHGQSGDGTFGVAPYYGTGQPELIVASNVTTIAAGFFHSLFLESDGSLWAMGENNYGQLGDGTYLTNHPYSGTNRPELIVASNVTAIAAGGAHSLFLKGGGSLWAMGWNAYGQLGDGTTNNVNAPELIVASNVTAIAAGYGFSLFLKGDGSLWAMGDNRNGQLGDGRFGSAPYYGTNRPEPIVAGGVTAIAAGEYHSLFLKDDDSLWAMGYNGNGGLGNGTFSTAPDFGINRPQQIVAPYNRVSVQFLSGGEARLSFVGVAGTNYALDRCFSLTPTDWVPQATNAADSAGLVIFTNTPDPATNVFWRIRSVPGQ